MELVCMNTMSIQSYGTKLLLFLQNLPNALSSRQSKTCIFDLAYFAAYISIPAIPERLLPAKKEVVEPTQSLSKL
jgi:hypothetical protein